MKLACRFNFHCWHEDYDKPYTWEDVKTVENHGQYKPKDIYERKNPPPPPPVTMPAGYINVCCHCNKKKLLKHYNEI